MNEKTDRPTETTISDEFQRKTTHFINRGATIFALVRCGNILKRHVRI